MHAVEDLDKSMRGVLRPAVFENEDGFTFNDEKLQQNSNKPAITGYFGTAVMSNCILYFVYIVYCILYIVYIVFCILYIVYIVYCILF